MQTLLMVHAAATWFMTGLIWTVQVVHYPLFHAVGTDAFPNYEAGHTRRIGWLLVVPAGVEVATAGILFLAEPAALTFAAGALLAAIWVMTALVHGPIHGRLAAYDEALVSRLVAANWWRTLAWTLRAVLAAVMLSVL